MEVEELLAAQHQLLRSFLRATGDLPAPAEPEPARALGRPELPPCTPWVHSSPTRPRAEPSAAPHSLQRTDALPHARSAAPAPRPLAFSADASLNHAHDAELSRALAEARHAELERQRLHRLSEMHATTADAAIAKAARLEAALEAARSSDAQRAHREAELDAALIASRARIAELEALEGERRLHYEHTLEGSAHDSLQRARAARAQEEGLRRELEAARRALAERATRDEAQRVQADELRDQVGALRQQVAEARAVADEDDARARGLQRRLEALEPELLDARERARAALAEAARVPALQRALEEARVRAAAGSDERRGDGSGARGGGGAGGGDDGARVAELERALAGARRQCASLESELGAALGREEALHGQQQVLLRMQRGLEEQLADNEDRAARAEPRGAARAGEGGAAQPQRPSTAAAEPPAALSRCGPGAQPPPSAADGGGGGGGVGPASAGFEFSSGEQPSRPSIRTYEAPLSRVPYALAAEGAPGGGSATRAQLEARHMELSLERDRAQAEYARMPASSGRTLAERRQKAQLEQRLEDLAAELGSLNVRLRPM